MRVVASACCVMVILALSTHRVDAGPLEKKTGQEPSTPKFVVYSAKEDVDAVPSLVKVLRGKDAVTTVTKVDSIEAAIASKAEVLVFVMSGHEPLKLEPEALDALKKRKIIGIGYGSAQLFKQLRLEINSDACAHGGPARISLTKCVLLGDPKPGDQISILQQTPPNKPGARDHDIFAMHIPRKSSESSIVDVIGRWPGDENYAPIVRQGNCIMIGFTFPASMWSAEYAAFFRKLCIALHDRKREDFATARRELTKPGTYNFKLAKGRSTEELSSKKFFFQFREATKITARLEHQGSSAVMLMFRGEDGTHPTRKDGGPTLDLTVDISREDIQNLGDRHWALWVTNFDRGAPVDCKLTIECEKP